MSEAQEAIERWDRFAAEFTSGYAAEGDPARIAVLNPALLGLLGDVEGAAILDAGSGEGYLSRMLARRGATVTAVDFSQSMLELAHARTPPDLPIAYHHGDLAELSFLSSATFDYIVSNLAMQDLPEYRAAIAESHRLLKPGGSLIFSILHPCFVTPDHGWVRDEQGVKQYRRVDRYFAEGRYEQPVLGDVFWYHRTLGSYVGAVRGAGFILEELVEPQPPAELLAAYPSMEDILRIPDFLIFKCAKPR